MKLTHRQNTKPETRANRPEEPMAEGPMKNRRPNGFFSKMSDDELIRYAKRAMEERGITGRKELEKADGRLYQVLGKRKLRERIGFEEKRRDWEPMSDDELVRHARRLMEEKGITGKSELQKADYGLYQVLNKRKLLKRIRFEEKQRTWSSMGDEELTGHARGLIAEKELKTRAELQKADNGLYIVLRTRKLLDKIEFEEKRRDWRSMSDDELVAHAQRFMEEKGITGRGELANADWGLYQIVTTRNLLAQVFAPMEESRQVERTRGIAEFMDGFGGPE